LSGNGQSKLKLSGNGNECKPLGDGEEQKIIEIPIIDDDSYEPDENFFVKLCKPTAGAYTRPLLNST